MKQTLVRSALITALVVILPGCVLINTVLGVVGLMSSGPVQYMGAAYSIGEYTYEYTVNDKTPDEVIVAKVAWLFGSDDEPEAVKYANNVPLPANIDRPISTPNINLASAKAVLRPERRTSAPSLMKVKLTPADTSTPSPIVVAAATKRQSKPQRVKRPTTRPVSPRTSVAQTRSPAPAIQTLASTSTPRHTYVEHAPDPLLERMTRMEQSFALAERMANHKPIKGIRYSVKTKEAGQTLTINGSWSIRHDVMQSPPDSENDSVLKTSPQATLQTIS